MGSHKDRSYTEAYRLWKRNQLLDELHETRKRLMIEEYNRKNMSKRRDKESHSRRPSRTQERRERRSHSSSSSSEGQAHRLRPVPPLLEDHRAIIDRHIANAVAEINAPRSTRSTDTTSHTRTGAGQPRRTDPAPSRATPKNEPRTSADRRGPQPSTSGIQQFVESSGRGGRDSGRDRDRDHDPDHRRDRYGDSHRVRIPGSGRDRVGSRDRSRSREHSDRHNHGQSPDRNRCSRCGHRHTGSCSRRQDATRHIPAPPPRQSESDNPAREDRAPPHAPSAEGNEVRLWLPGGNLLITQTNGELHNWWRYHSRGPYRLPPPIWLPFPPFNPPQVPSIPGPVELEAGTTWYPPGTPPLPPRRWQGPPGPRPDFHLRR